MLWIKNTFCKTHVKHLKIIDMLLLMQMNNISWNIVLIDNCYTKSTMVVKGFIENALLFYMLNPNLLTWKFLHQDSQKYTIDSITLTNIPDFINYYKGSLTIKNWLKNLEGHIPAFTKNGRSLLFDNQVRTKQRQNMLFIWTLHYEFQ